MSNAEETLLAYDENAAKHGYSTLIKGEQPWLKPSFVLQRVEDLNTLNQQNQNLREEIKEKQLRLAEITSAPSSTWSPEEKKEATELVQTLASAEDTLALGEETFNKEYEKAKQYLKINKTVGGDIVAHFTTANGKDLALTGTNDPQNPISPKAIEFAQKMAAGVSMGVAGGMLLDPNVLETQIIEELGFSPKQQWMWDDDQVELIHKIVGNFLAGTEDQITNEDWINLYGTNYNVQGDAYNILMQNIFDAKFEYNIKRNINERLVDIRNVKNFRASNITTDAKVSVIEGQNIINPTTADGSCASKSFYMSRNDFYWSQNYKDIVDQRVKSERQSIQNIILNQYQPTLQYNIGSEIFGGVDQWTGEKVDQGLQNLSDKAGFDGLGDFIKWGVNKGAIWLYNEKLDVIGKAPQRLYGEENYNSAMNPMYYVEHLFNNGTWLNTYELPFIENEKVKTDYLKNSVDPGTWSIGGLTDVLEEGGFTEQVLQNRISLSLPTSPTFNVENPHNATMGNIKINFYLINKDDFYLAKNFQFMQALFAGTQWLAMDLGTIVATNVYHVLVPGRFVIQWAALQSQFQAVGKLRTNEYMYAQYGNGNGSINQIGLIERDTLWPEAWHLNLTIKPLTPWNFNTHMAYYLHGFGAGQKTRLATMKSAWWNSGIGIQNERNQIEEAKKRSNIILEQIKQNETEQFNILARMHELQEMHDISKHPEWAAVSYDIDKRKKYTYDFIQWSGNSIAEFKNLEKRLAESQRKRQSIIARAQAQDREMLAYEEEVGSNSAVAQSQTIMNQLAIPLAESNKKILERQSMIGIIDAMTERPGPNDSTGNLAAGGRYTVLYDHTTLGAPIDSRISKVDLNNMVKVARSYTPDQLKTTEYKNYVSMVRQGIKDNETLSYEQKEQMLGRIDTSLRNNATKVERQKAQEDIISYTANNKYDKNAQAKANKAKETKNRIDRENAVAAQKAEEKRNERIAYVKAVNRLDQLAAKSHLTVGQQVEQANWQKVVSGKSWQFKKEVEDISGGKIKVKN